MSAVSSIVIIARIFCNIFFNVSLVIVVQRWKRSRWQWELNCQVP